MATTQPKTVKYILQGRGECPHCKRMVDIRTTNAEAGLLLTRHYIVGQLKFCIGSMKPYGGQLVDGLSKGATAKPDARQPSMPRNFGRSKR